MFGEKSCTEESFSLVKDNWSKESQTVTFDLLKDTKLDKALPALTISPIKCYKTTWQLLKTSDKTNMVTSNSNTFAIVDPNLTLSHEVSNYERRKSLYGSHNVYL